MRHVRALDYNNGNGAFLAGIVLRHIKIHRLVVQNIAVRRADLDQRIAFSVGQLFGRHEIAVCIGVKYINGGGRRVGVGHFHFAAVRVVDFKSCTRIRNDLARFRIGLDDLDIALEVGVVDEIAVGRAGLRDIHIKVRHQLSTVPA